MIKINQSYFQPGYSGKMIHITPAEYNLYGRTHDILVDDYVDGCMVARTESACYDANMTQCFGYMKDQ